MGRYPVAGEYGGVFPVGLLGRRQIPLEGRQQQKQDGRMESHVPGVGADGLGGA
jgi:hypothetical protein